MPVSSHIQRWNIEAQRTAQLLKIHRRHYLLSGGTGVRYAFLRLLCQIVCFIKDYILNITDMHITKNRRAASEIQESTAAAQKYHRDNIVFCFSRSSNFALNVMPSNTNDIQYESRIEEHAV